jgi:hypothetical protein
MGSADEKRAEIDLFLQGKDIAQRKELEKIISGASRPGDFILPVVLNGVALAGIILFVTIGTLDVCTLISIVLLALAICGWGVAFDRIVNRRFNALKNYVDLILAERESDKK